MPHSSSFALVAPQGVLRLVALAALGWALLTGEPLHLLFAVVLVAVLAGCGRLLRHLQHAKPGTAQQLAAAGLQGSDKAETQDELLGIASRGALERQLDEEWRRERRDGEPTALLLVAVDDFDTLKEHGGQLAGDVALLTLARSLARMLPRRADLLARYDHSTFAVVLPGTDLPGSLRVAARLRWSIVRLGIAHPCAESGFVSASLGIAVQHGLLGRGSESLLDAAETALRKAQSQGPDRLEYTVLNGKDRHELQPQSLLSLPSIRAWTPERESMQPSTQL